MTAAPEAPTPQRFAPISLAKSEYLDRHGRAYTTIAMYARRAHVLAAVLIYLLWRKLRRNMHVTN